MAWNFFYSRITNDSASRCFLYDDRVRQFLLNFEYKFPLDYVRNFLLDLESIINEVGLCPRYRGMKLVISRTNSIVMFTFASFYFRALSHIAGTSLLVFSKSCLAMYVMLYSPGLSFIRIVSSMNLFIFYSTKSIV